MAEIAIVHPGWLSLIVDGGRHGHADIGVPPSSALDGLAFAALNKLLGNDAGAPAIEVFGTEFSLAFSDETTVAVTGARVAAFLDGVSVEPWAAFRASAGSVLRVASVLEGFRYYVGFSGRLELPLIMGSFSTHLECMFGGFKGRPLVKGDRLTLNGGGRVELKAVPASHLPDMSPPHVLRVLDGPEKPFLTGNSHDIFCHMGELVWYAVSAKSNRTGIRLEGGHEMVAEGAAGSIVSEGILPGTIQVPPDGRPIITLFERTMGGYARAGIVVSSDLDRLAHLKPKDRVRFEGVTPSEALSLSTTRRGLLTSLYKTIGG